MGRWVLRKSTNCTHEPVSAAMRSYKLEKGEHDRPVRDVENGERL